MPNIVLITSDQHRGDCFGFEGRSVKTPHLDFLARNGTRFAACIAPSPICQPARASILTGLLPLTHGVRDNGIDLEPEVGDAGFAGRIAAAGWRTGLIGKAHFSTFVTFAPTGRPENRLSLERYPADWCGPYMGFEHVELLHCYERWLDVDGHGAEKRRLARARLAPDTDAARTWYSALPAAWHPSAWIGDRAIRYIDDHAREPFLLWVSFPDPHAPFDAPEPWSRLHDPAEVDLPTHRELDLDLRPWWHRTSLESAPAVSDPDMRRVRETLSRLPRQTDEQLRYITAQYYGMISLIDHTVGRIVNRLYENGLADRTILVFTSDHGELLGDHGLLLKGPMHYEGLLRVGCIAWGPGIPGGRIVDEPVSTLDLAPTFLEYASLPVPKEMHGRSLRTLMEGGKDRRVAARSEWQLGPERCGISLDLVTVRTRRYKLTLERRSGDGELYDLADDPHEMRNRFGDPAFATIAAELVGMIETRPRDVRTPSLPVVGMA